jgi:hypothetical protein
MDDTYEGWEEDYMEGFNHETTKEEDDLWEAENSDSNDDE